MGLLNISKNLLFHESRNAQDPTQKKDGVFKKLVQQGFAA